MVKITRSIKIGGMLTTLAFCLSLGVFVGSASAQEKTILRVAWMDGLWSSIPENRPDVQSQYINAYHKIHPNVKVEIESMIGDTEGRTKYLLECRQGNQADIVTLDGFWVAEFASAGYTVPLDNFLSEKIKNDYYGPFLVKYKGKIHAVVPGTAFNSMMWYRNDLVKEAGLPGPPISWYDLAIWAKKLTKTEAGRTTMYGLSVSGAKSEHTTCSLLGMYWQGANVFVSDNNQAMYNNQVSKDIFALFKEMYREDHSLPPGTLSNLYQDAQTLFFTEKTAMTLHGSWLTSFIYDAAPNLKGKVDLSYTPIYPKTGHRGTNAGGWAIAITSPDPSKYQLAYDFLKLDVEGSNLHLMRLKEIGYLPVQKSLAANPYFSRDKWARMVISCLPYSNTRPAVEIYPEASLNWAEAFQKSFLGQNIEAALESAAQKTDNQAKARGYTK